MRETGGKTALSLSILPGCSFDDNDIDRAGDEDVNVPRVASHASTMNNRTWNDKHTISRTCLNYMFVCTKNKNNIEVHVHYALYPHDHVFDVLRARMCSFVCACVFMCT